MKSKEFAAVVKLLRRLGYSVDTMTVNQIIETYRKEKELNK